MNQQELARFCSACVHKFLRGRENLSNLREDLEQEAYVAVLKAKEHYDESKGTDEKLYYDYQVRYALNKYVDRNEKPHWQEPMPPESPYWDLEDVTEVEEIPDEDPNPGHRQLLLETLAGSEYTERQLEFIRTFCELGDMKLTWEAMGITKQRAHILFQQIVKKAKKDNGLE